MSIHVLVLSCSDLQCPAESVVGLGEKLGVAMSSLVWLQRGLVNSHHKEFQY